MIGGLRNRLGNKGLAVVLERTPLEASDEIARQTTPLDPG